MLLGVEHKTKQAPPADGHESAIQDPSDLHGHGSACADRVRPDVFWGKDDSGRANLSGIGPEDRDGIQGDSRV